jgi:hypothetical protein
LGDAPSAGGFTPVAQGEAAVKLSQLPPRLLKGELIRLTADGPIHTVVRTTVGAAYIKVGDWTTGEPGGVLGGLESHIEGISPYSFVYRVRKEDYGGQTEATKV